MSDTLGQLLASANMRETPPQEMSKPDLEIVIDGAPQPKMDSSGVLTTELPDGSLTIDFSGGKEKPQFSEDFNANLAGTLGLELGNLANQLISEIDSDIQGRAEWMDM